VGRNDQLRTGMPLMVAVVALTFASGVTDITSFTRLGNVFSSVMTANLALLGLAVARESGELATHTAVAFIGYVVGVAFGTRVPGPPQQPDVPWPHRVTTTLAAELVIFAGFTAGWELTGARPTGASQLALLAVGTLAMGTQSSAMRNVGPRISTTYLTGTLTGAVASLVRRDRPLRELGLEFAALGALAAGAAAGGGLLFAAPRTVPILQMAALSGVIAMAITLGVRE
jgi:uncharacterized membrane protein YoaK (UPF0700 family)